jgi:hypothetical protein
VPESVAVRRHHTNPTTHEVQAAAELGASGGELVDTDHIEFMGERFRLATNVALMPLLKFAHAANVGLDSMEMEGLAALYAVIRDCILDHHRLEDEDGKTIYEPTEASVKEWARFENHAMVTGADDQDLMKFVNAAIERISARPRRRPGPSSAGPPTTSPGSKASPSSPDTEALAGLVPVDSLVDH